MKRILLIGPLSFLMIGLSVDCNKFGKFDIVGTWTIALKSDKDVKKYTIKFNGTEAEGEWVIPIYDNNQEIGGYYKITDGIVEMKLNRNFLDGITGIFNGSFKSENEIDGDFSIFHDNVIKIQGVWVAIR